MNIFKLLFSIGFFIVSFSAFADVPPLVEKALKNSGVSNYANWAYTRELNSNKEDNREERYNPGQNPVWRLIAVNERIPSKKQFKKYEKLDESDLDYDHPGDLPTEGFIKLETIQLLEEHEQYATYSFLVEDEEDPEFSQHIVGEMTIDKTSSFPYVKQVVLKNTKPFSPQVGVKVKEFESIMELSPISKVGPVFITKQTDTFKGRAMGLMSISDVQVVIFKDFEFVGGR